MELAANRRAAEAEAAAEAEIRRVEEEEAVKIAAEVRRAEAAMKALKVQAKTTPAEQKQSRDETVCASPVALGSLRFPCASPLCHF